jgi:hypothetical protein
MTIWSVFIGLQCAWIPACQTTPEGGVTVGGLLEVEVACALARFPGVGFELLEQGRLAHLAGSYQDQDLRFLQLSP